MPQPCPVHKIDLLPHGPRLTISGFIGRTLGNAIVAYRAVEKDLFPRANALRIGNCVRSHGKGRVHYCPQCRKALFAWCHRQKDDKLESAEVANLILELGWSIDYEDEAAK